MTPAGDAVHAAVADLGVPFRFERSVKLRAARLEDERFLVSVERRHLGDPASCWIAALLDRLGFPASARDWLRRHGQNVIALHLGHEAAGERLVRKVYLEYAVERSPTGCDPADGGTVGTIVHRALKWDLGSDALGETVYWLAPRAILDAGPLARGPAAALARELLRRADASGGSIVLLDVREEATTRRSFDLQLYDLALRGSDWRDGLARLERSFGLADGRLAAALPPEALLGHLAGGCDAQGQPFATLYFGARWRR